MAAGLQSRPAYPRPSEQKGRAGDRPRRANGPEPGRRDPYLADPALAGLRGGRAGRLVREAVNRLEDLVGLLEVREMSGFPDRLEPAMRE